MLKKNEDTTYSDGTLMNTRGLMMENFPEGSI